jgi:hypothetical protein
MGRSAPRPGQAAADCIVWAARSVLAGEAAALVTAPIHKEALAAAGGWAAGFPGHTEMLQAEAAAFWANRERGAGAHDAGQRRTQDRVGEHSHVAEAGD